MTSDLCTCTTVKYEATEHGVVKSELLEKEYEWSKKMGTKSTKHSWGDADPDKPELDAVE